MQLLMDYGLDPEQDWGKCWNALNLAVFHSNTDCIQVLLSWGVDPNRPSGPERLTPLEEAIDKARYYEPGLDIVKLLLECGTEPTIRKSFWDEIVLGRRAVGNFFKRKHFLEKYGITVNAWF